MTPVYARSAQIVSAIGINTDAHWNAVAEKKSGIRRHEDEAFSKIPFWASKLDAAQWQHIHAYTDKGTLLSAFEQLAIYTASTCLSKMEEEINLDETVLILSTTKGNIEWLDEMPDDRNTLYRSTDIISNQMGIKNKPVIISHACVSGVSALIYGLRLLQAGRYRHALVVGCDRFTKFILSGFQSFQAIADEPCRPFDANRKGINLGEAAAAILLSVDAGENPLTALVSGATSNDANHISGPSRTGDELAMAVQKAMKEANVEARQIDMISAHGTATLYNDEMESKAFAQSGLSTVPTHSFKGYIGHTLGAAGIAESVMVLESMKRQLLIPSIGFGEMGVTEKLNITTEVEPASIQYVLKTASGFGGCNAAIIWTNALIT